MFLNMHGQCGSPSGHLDCLGVPFWKEAGTGINAPVLLKTKQKGFRKLRSIKCFLNDLNLQPEGSLVRKKENKF